MTKNNVFLILFVIALATVYAIWFTDWFTPKTVRIFHTSRNLRPAAARRGGAVLPNLTFGVTHTVRLTEIVVVPLAVFETNKSVSPLWHLVSDSNSVPIKLFAYGQGIGGMHPALKGVRPEPLETNVMYRMFVTAGKIKGQHDFEIE